MWLRHRCRYATAKRRSRSRTAPALGGWSSGALHAAAPRPTAGGANNWTDPGRFTRLVVQRHAVGSASSPQFRGRRSAKHARSGSRVIPWTVAAIRPLPCRPLRRSAPSRYKHQWRLSMNMRIGRPPRFSGVPQRSPRAGHAPTARRALLLGEVGGGAVELNSANAPDYAQCRVTTGKPS